MKNSNIKLVLLSLVLISFASCVSDDAPVIINEEELITTVEYTLTNTTDAANVVVIKSVDPDGDAGGQQPNITVNGTIRANSSYLGEVRFLNETTSPADNITDEVSEESEDHEVFYVTPIAGLQITKLDNDTAGNPLGLLTTFETGAAGSGDFTIVLRHLPKKPNNGTLSDAGGESDAESRFQLSIQ